MKRMAIKAVFSAVLLLAGLYAGDYLVLRYRRARGRAFGSVTVYRYYAIAKKANRVEYDPAGTEQRTCVRSLLPQMGYPPCWYAKRHTDERIDL